MAWKVLELLSGQMLSDAREQRNKEYNKSELQGENYPNYPVVNYNPRQDALPGFDILLYGSYGFLGAVFIGLPLIHRKYRLLGYREWKLTESLCIPLIKCTVLCTIGGMGVGSLFEVRRIARQDFDEYYNKKVI